jgi:hypothetical protein
MTETTIDERTHGRWGFGTERLRSGDPLYGKKRTS